MSGQTGSFRAVRGNLFEIFLPGFRWLSSVYVSQHGILYVSITLSPFSQNENAICIDLGPQ